MIRFLTLLVVAALILYWALGGVSGPFGGVTLLAVGVAGFGLFVGLFTELLRQT